MKTNILFINEKKNTGVHYYRTLLPAVKLQELYPDDFHVDIVQHFDFSDVEQLRKYHIIHAHTTLADFGQLEEIVKNVKSFGIKIVIDLDDIWEVPKTHPAYLHVKNGNLAEGMIKSLKLADYVTCTTAYFADRLKKYNPNVIVLENAVDLNSENFKNKKVETDCARIGYLAGSSHQEDLKQMNGFMNTLLSDTSLKDKFSMSLNGFDTSGYVDNFTVRTDFIQDLSDMGLYNEAILKEIKNNLHTIHKVKGIPPQLLAKYSYNILEIDRQPINPKKTSWYEYEVLLTDNYKLIKDKRYKDYLMQFQKEVDCSIVHRQNSPFSNEKYIRNWTKPVGDYATLYNNIDISIAPLLDNEFNRCKSEVKLIEAFSRKIAVVASDVSCYNVYGKNNKNCILIPYDGRDKKWSKALKKLIKEPNLRKDLGEQLYEDFHKIFDINVVSEKRKDFYKKIVE